MHMTFSRHRMNSSLWFKRMELIEVIRLIWAQKGKLYIIYEKIMWILGILRFKSIHLLFYTFIYISGAIQDFKLGGVHLIKLRRAEGDAKFVWVFHVKNHDFTPKNQIFSNCGGRREIFWGISCEKSRSYAKKSYFFQLRREARNILGYFVWKITPAICIFQMIVMLKISLDWHH
jgi:hypothetical protein